MRTSARPALDVAALFAPLAPYTSWGLAVSGGPDSLALMLLAQRWRREAPTPPALYVYTVDHGLRPEAADEAAMVAREAERLGLPVRCLRWEGEKPATGLQEAARAARYDLMAEAMRADGAEILLTAHHRDDQAETVLMRLAHGSGIEGLRGMALFADVAGLRIARPLLGADPADLAALVAAAGFTPARDPSNHDPDYERVRWRQMLPALEALGLDARRLARFAERMGEADAALDTIAVAALSDLVSFDAADAAAKIPATAFAALPRAIAIRVLATALGRIGAWRKPHALAAVETLTRKLQLGGALRASTLHGCVVRSDGTTISLVREKGRVVAGRAGKRAVVP